MYYVMLCIMLCGTGIDSYVMCGLCTVDIIALDIMLDGIPVSTTHNVDGGGI